MERGTWWAIVHGVTRSQTWLRDFHFHFWVSPVHATEKAVTPHSSTLAWKIPWMEEPGRNMVGTMGSLRVSHDWVTLLSLFTFMHWRKWQSTPVFLPGEYQGQGSLVSCRLWDHMGGLDWNDLAAAAAIPKLFRSYESQRHYELFCIL